MRFEFEQCVDLFRGSILAALSERGTEVRTLNQSEPLWAISFDLIPWQPYSGLAFRLATESNYPASQNSADWKYSHFIENHNSKPMSTVADYIHSVHLNFVETQWNEVTHLLYLAGAHALLDAKVAHLLRDLGIDAPVVDDRLTPTYFKYFVLDSDVLIAANYCDIVRANHITRLMLGTVV